MSPIRICVFVTVVVYVFMSAMMAVAQTGEVDYQKLDERLTRLADEPAVVGLAVAVIEDGEITFAEGYGVTKLGGEAVSEDTVFRWASLSKGVASTAIGKMAAEGELALSDTISKFQTSLRLPMGGEKVGTLEDLLAHKIGIVPNAYDTRLEDGGEEDDPEVDEAGEDGHRLVGVHAVQEDGAAGTQKI